MPRKQRLVCVSCGKEFFYSPEQYDTILAQHEGPRHRWRCRQCVALAYKFDHVRYEGSIPEWKREQMIPPGATLESQYRTRGGLRAGPPVCSRCGGAVGAQEAAEPPPILCRTCKDVEDQRFSR